MCSYLFSADIGQVTMEFVSGTPDLVFFFWGGGGGDDLNSNLVIWIRAMALREEG